MDYNLRSLPALYYLPEFAQTHVHWVSDAFQPFHPLPGKTMQSIWTEK